jgi:CheY-like chemotaxis protein
VYDTIFSSDIEVGLVKEAEQFIEQEIEEIENEIKELQEKLVPKGNRGQRQGRAIDLLKNYTEVLDSMAKSNVNYKEILSLKIENEHKVNDVKNHISQKEELLKEKNNLIQNKYQKLITEQRKINLNSKLAKLQVLKGTVVLVDDLADKGWENIYKGIVGTTISIVKENIPKSNKEFDAIHLANSILAKQPNAILLDMRLFENEENIYYPSGIKVLIELRKLNTIVPIIVCSASNRGTIINKVHKLGADFYWVKEGADLEFGFDESIKNYERLIEYLQTVLSKEQYKIQSLFHTFQESIISSEIPHWWEKKDWVYEHSVVSKGNTMSQIIVERETEVHNPEVIFEIITNAIKNISKELIKANYSKRESDWTFCSKTISDLGNIIEIVHRFDVIKSHIDIVRKDNINYTYIRDVGSGNIAHKKKGQFFGRNDKQGKYLYNLRNRAAHYQTAKQIEMIIVLDYLERMLSYLIEPNLTTNEKIIFEKDGDYYIDQKCETGWFKKNKKTI